MRLPRFNDALTAAAARSRAKSSVWRAWQAGLFGLAGALALQSALMAAIWLAFLFACIRFERHRADRYIATQPGPERARARTGFVQASVATAMVLNLWPLAIAALGGGEGQMAAALIVASAVINTVILHSEDRLLLSLRAGPYVVVLIALPLLQGAQGPLQPIDYAAFCVAVVSFVFTVWKTLAAVTRQRTEALEARAAAEQGRAEAEARRLEAEAAGRAKSHFLATMSHELRTPLNAVIGYAEILQEDLEHEGRDRSAKDALKIQAAARNLLGLIDQVLDLSKIESGEMALDVGEVDAALLIEEAMAQAAPAASAKGVALRYEALSALGTISTDVIKLRTCLLHLLTNACKFTATGEIVVRARRTAEGGQAWLAISVTDTGPGMTKAQTADLFRPFAQVDPSHTRANAGAGLGLAVTRKLIQLLGGEVLVDSAPGAGSTFTLRAPTRRFVEPAEDPATQDPATQAVDVLVIDDDSATLELVARAAERIGLTSQGAATMEQGWAAACMLKPALIVLDIVFPDGEGWALLKRVRRDPALADTPVIVLSVGEHRARAAAEGAALFLQKPAGRDALCSAMARLATAAGGPGEARRPSAGPAPLGAVA